MTLPRRGHPIKNPLVFMDIDFDDPRPPPLDGEVRRMADGTWVASRGLVTSRGLRLWAWEVIQPTVKEQWEDLLREINNPPDG